MFRILILACLAFLASAAPVQTKVDKPLARAKRSEEAIIFGNHQNFARVKKANPHPFPMHNEPAVEDKSDNNDLVDAQVPLTEQLNAADVQGSDKGAAQPPPSQSEAPTEDEEAQIEKLLTPDEHEEEGNEQGDQEEEKEEEEMMLERLMEEEARAGAEETPVEPPHSEGLPIAHPEEVLNKEDPTLEEEEEAVASGEAESTLEDMEKPAPYYKEDSKYEYGPYYESRDYEDNLPLSSALYKSFREKRSAGKSRAARSLQKTAATAEDMMTSAESAAKKLGGRVKRDLPLSPEELEDMRDYIDNMAPEEYDMDERYYPGVEQQVMDRRASPSEGWGGDYEEEGLPDNVPAFDVDPRSYDPQMYLPEEPVEVNDVDPEEQRRLELLEYLYSQEAQPTYEGVPDYRGDFEESWHDLGPAKEVVYEPEPYEEEDEEEEDFAPSKRQYLSLVPGVKREWNDKRDQGQFYPYQYGPDGRWGAMVVDPDVEKRNEMAEYERLYELAQALNGPDSPRGYEKRFDDGYGPEESFDYWDRKRK